MIVIITSCLIFSVKKRNNKSILTRGYLFKSNVSGVSSGLMGLWVCGFVDDRFVIGDQEFQGQIRQWYTGRPPNIGPKHINSYIEFKSKPAWAQFIFQYLSWVKITPPDSKNDVYSYSDFNHFQYFKQFMPYFLPLRIRKSEMLQKLFKGKQNSMA